MATQLSLVNRVLRRLREDTVTTVGENDYSKLIADFVNEAKSDMEDINYEWSAYIVEIDTTITADGDRTYDLTSTNDRSWLMRQTRDQRPMAFDVTTSSDRYTLQDIPYKTLKKWRAEQTGEDVSNPYVFTIYKDNTNGGWTMELLWGASEARTWRMYWYIPQGDLAIDGTDDNTVIQLPEFPLYRRALYYALEDRGEAMGPALTKVWRDSVDAIGAAIEVDRQHKILADDEDVTNLEHIGHSRSFW